MRGGRRPPAGALQAQAQWGAVRPSGADKPTLVILFHHQARPHRRGSEDVFVCECFDLFVREETDSEKGRDWHDVTQQRDSESEEKPDPHSWQQAVTWHRRELRRRSLVPGKNVLN